MLIKRHNRKKHKPFAKPGLELRAPQWHQYPYLIFLLPPSAGCRPSELKNEVCDLLWLIFFSFCEACAQLVTLEQTLKSRETFHVVKAKGVLKCSGRLICSADCRTEFQHAHFIVVRRGRFRIKICYTLCSISVPNSFVFLPLSTNLILTVHMFLFPCQGPFLRVLCDYNWKSQ